MSAAAALSIPAPAFPRVSPGPRDRATLERLRQAARVPDPPAAEQDYRGLVVQKPWGFEFLVYDTPEVAVWRLRIDTGHSTSMHCHPRKRTALVVLAGHGLCHVFGRRVVLAPFDVVMLEPGVFHATKAVSGDGLDLVEVESPRCKTDLVRLNDLYGREGAGYEGLREMQTDRLERFGHFMLSLPETGGAPDRYVDPERRFELGVGRFDEAGLQAWSLTDGARALVLVDGSVDDRAGRPAGGLGDALLPSAAGLCHPAGATTVTGLTVRQARRHRATVHPFAPRDGQEPRGR